MIYLLWGKNFWEIKIVVLYVILVRIVMDVNINVLDFLFLLISLLVKVIDVMYIIEFLYFIRIVV